ncbi:hypothetical protein AB1Y20_015852 [Prymnesium parvum]|uniref:ShKT domain-containing protein n=1 Tax=Prymnesium parvum TaxID=97485 RepID=A0AB34K1N1_PRYPA
MLALLLTLAGGVTAAPRLHDAVGQDSPAAIQAFLDAGASLNERDHETGQTPLMFAVLNGFSSSVKYLLSVGADATISEKDGYTPLHGAAFQGRAEIAQILLDHGLDPNDRHRDGYTPLIRACWGQEERHTETVLVLLKAGVHPDPLCLKVTRNDETRKAIHHYTWKDRPLATEPQDRNSMCAQWAEAGQCEENPGYMLEYCEISCGRHKKLKKEL